MTSSQAKVKLLAMMFVTIGVTIAVLAPAQAVAQERARSIRSASFQGDYESQGRRPEIRTIELELVEALPDLLQELADLLLGLAAPQQSGIYVRHRHVQSVDGTPHAVCDSYVPRDILGADWKSLDDGEVGLSELLIRQGKRATSKDEYLWFAWATAEEKEMLSYPSAENAPVIRLRCAQLAEREILELCLLVDRADLYEFHYRVDL